MKYVALIFLQCLACLPAARAADTMHAVVLANGKLSVETVPMPQPQAGQVRIRVHAASVNPVDWKLADRATPGSRTIPGRDLAGVIDAIGPEAGPWHVGQAVIAVASDGAYAEYAIAPIRAVALKPEHLSFEEAAGMPVVGETAWRALVAIANVHAGQRVLIQGGAGGVGSSAVQIAKAKGAFVIATASATHAALLRSLGADQVIDYHLPHYQDGIRNLDIVLNTVDPQTGVVSVPMIRRGGTLVSVVHDVPAPQCKAAGLHCESTGPVTGEFLAALSDLADRGQFHVNIDQRLPLAQAAKAWELNRSGHTGGKIILDVSL